MKRSIILSVYAVSSLVLYCGFCLVYFFCTQLIFPVWFSLGCFFIGVYALLKSYFFALDSSLWLGLALTFVALFGFLHFFQVVSAHNLVFWYVLVVPLSSIITAFFYKKYFLLTISFILILEDFLILLYSNNIISSIWFWAISAIWAVLCIGGNYAISRQKRQ